MEVAANFPEECRYVLETLRDVYDHDAEAREQAFRRNNGCGFIRSTVGR